MITCVEVELDRLELGEGGREREGDLYGIPFRLERVEVEEEEEECEEFGGLSDERTDEGGRK